MGEQLADKACIPCRGGVPPLEGDELERLLGDLGNGWTVVDGHHLNKEYSFGNFIGATHRCDPVP